MKESRYKIYLGYATGVVPPKMARKFKKASPSKKDSDLVLVDEEPETKYKSKEKEKLDVTRGKGIELLFEVALTEEAQMKEVRNKSLRDFHKTHPSGSGTVAKKPPSIENINLLSTSEGTGDKPGVPDENESEEHVSDSVQEEESKDDDQEEEEFIHTPSPTDDNLESESDDVNKSNEESDDVNKSDEESDDVIKGDKEIVQGEGADAEMIDAQQGNENLETTQEQVVEDAHVTISTVTKKTEVPVTSSSRSSDLASKFLNFSDIPHTDAEIVSPLDVHVHHEVPRTQAPTLLTIPVSVITESSPSLSDCYDSLKKSYDLDKDFFFSYDVYSLKRIYKDKDKDEDPFAGSDRGLKKRKISKDAEPTTGPKKKDSMSGSSKGTKSQPKFSREFVQSEEPIFEVADLDMPQDQKGNLGDNEDEPRNETAFRCYWFKKPTPPQEPTNSDWYVGKTTQEGPTQNWLMTLAASTSTDTSCDYPFDLSKPLLLITRGKLQRVPFEYFINNDLKYLQGGVSTMTYTMSTSKTKAAQYDLLGIEDMVLNIWSPVKVAYDRYAL
ncbi:hypothetical protein Tco_1250771 [Tanacetum coccineum]